MAHILIVDDEPAIRETLHALLARLGHQVTQAASGREGLERFGQTAFDLVISDVIMPEMNGFDFLQALQPVIHERIPFVILSSHDDREGVKAALYAGAFDYVLKPFDEDQVKAVVDRALEERRQWAEGHTGTSAPPRPAPQPAPPAASAAPAAGPAAPRGPVDVLARDQKVVTVSSPDADDGATPGAGRRSAGWKGLLRRIRGRS